MKRLLFFGMIAGLLVACSKDKFKTVPQVKINSFGPAEVRKGQFFELRATITDKEGDVQDSALLVTKVFNGTFLLRQDTIRRGLRSFGAPKLDEIELVATFIYGELVDNAIYQALESQDRNFAVGIIVQDRAGNRSEYVESDKIVLKKL